MEQQNDRFDGKILHIYFLQKDILFKDTKIFTASW